MQQYVAYFEFMLVIIMNKTLKCYRKKEISKITGMIAYRGTTSEVHLHIGTRHYVHSSSLTTYKT